jgi:hypothetical protein
MGSGKAFGHLITTNVCLYPARETDKLGLDANAAGNWYRVLRPGAR